MKFLWIFVLLHAVYAATDNFGSPYLKNNRLCHQWSCINNKLNLPDALPPREQFATTLKSLLPNDWQDSIPRVLDICYGAKPRRYTNTCPGQSLLHCALDQLIENCPEKSVRKNDACAPLATLAGFKYMFSQSRYINIATATDHERRPLWFIKNYFSSKCCDLPELFNGTTLEECGFNSVTHYYDHAVKNELQHNSYTHYATQKNKEQETGKNQVGYLGDNLSEDLLGCCDLTGFMEPSWRSECDFRVKWNPEGRFLIEDSEVTTSPASTTTTPKPSKFNDVRVVPWTCEQETCVFRKLNVVSKSGKVDMSEFSKLLDNFTNTYPEWTKAKGVAVRKCLSYSRVLRRGCEINSVLECVLDALSENCPHAMKHDPCKRSKPAKGDTSCQISAGKYGPKRRRQFCGLPHLVNPEVLSECSLTSISRMDFVPEVKPRKYSHWMPRIMCKELTPSTKCLMNKMGVMTKYGFMDYFKMKDRIRNLTRQDEWKSLHDIYFGAFTGTPLYKEHCNSAKKLINVVDAMVMTCPISKRKQTAQCTKLFKDMINSAPGGAENYTRNLEKIKKHYDGVYPHSSVHYNVRNELKKPSTIRPRNSGIPNLDVFPEVKVINIKPQIIDKQPLVVLPVYLRTHGKGTGSLSVRPYKDAALRSSPYGLRTNVDEVAAEFDVRK